MLEENEGGKRNRGMELAAVEGIGNQIGKLGLGVSRRRRVFRTGEEMRDETNAGLQALEENEGSKRNRGMKLKLGVVEGIGNKIGKLGLQNQRS